jgi:hypothetical protein
MVANVFCHVFYAVNRRNRATPSSFGVVIDVNRTWYFANWMIAAILSTAPMALMRIFANTHLASTVLMLRKYFIFWQRKQPLALGFDFL